LGEIHVGTGGWAYFRGPWRRNIEAYSQAFNFVEVNSTFYSYPDLRRVRSWRRRVPGGFRFAVRSNRDLTHREQLQPTDRSMAAYYKTLEICDALGADVLHLLTPSSAKLTEDKIRGISEFFKTVDIQKAQVAWEIRGNRAKTEWDLLTRVMQDHNVIHCADLSVELPKVHSETLYTRLLGKGKHNLYQFDDVELSEISRTAEGKSSKAYLVFHGGRMYEDAARLKVYRETGRFPTTSGPTGLDSLLEVMSEDAVFPSSRAQLIEDQGWKVVDLSPDERAHASVLLHKLPEKEYSNLEEIRRALVDISRG